MKLGNAGMLQLVASGSNPLQQWIHVPEIPWKIKWKLISDIKRSVRACVRGFLPHQECGWGAAAPSCDFLGLPLGSHQDLSSIGSNSFPPPWSGSRLPDHMEDWKGSTRLYLHKSILCYLKSQFTQIHIWEMEKVTSWTEQNAFERVHRF